MNFIHLNQKCENLCNKKTIWSIINWCGDPVVMNPFPPYKEFFINARFTFLRMCMLELRGEHEVWTMQLYLFLLI